jgi:hypothetical protein
MNMRTILPVVAVVLVLGSTLQDARAERATEAETRLVCENWLAYMVYNRGSFAGSADPKIVDVQELAYRDTVLARCFSIDPRGHVAVPILKELPPIKTYSEEYGLDASETVGFPQLLREVLLHRVRLFIRKYGSMDAEQPPTGDVLLGREHREEWDRFSVSRQEFDTELHANPPERWAVLGPLLTTAWDQDPPYNNDCPYGDGGRCLVGCVATAAAQIMKYHEWPPNGTGQHSYWWSGDSSCGGSTDGQWLSADFSDPYDWANMPDTCTEGSPQVQQDAVSELCYEVGVAFEMDYGACASGAWTYDALTVFPTYFRYSVAIDRADRNAHTAESWSDLIMAEIYVERPMQYRIFRHSIVCDGWADKYGICRVHMNYGCADASTWWYEIDHLYASIDPMLEYVIKNIIPMAETVWVIAPDSTGDFITIGAAVGSGQVDDGDIIELTDGVFTGTGNRSIDYGGKAITIRSQSGNPDSCIIDCQFQGERAFIFESGEGEGSVLEGVTIRRGIAYLGGAVYIQNSSPTFIYCIMRSCSADYGGAVYCRNASPNFTNCTLRENGAEGLGGYGGAVYMWENSSPTFDNCTFHNNDALHDYGGGGAILSYQSSPEFTDCAFTSNFAWYDGGAIYGYDTEGIFTECHFMYNSTRNGGAISCVANSPVVFRNCVFTLNETSAPIASKGGAVYCDSSSALFENCEIIGNRADRGGAAYCVDSTLSPTFRHCTLSGNSVGTPDSGGAFYCDNSAAILISTIVANSTDGGIHFVNSPNCHVAYCDFFNGFADFSGTGPPNIGVISGTNANGDPCDQYNNIFLDPSFADEQLGNFSLWIDSPCIGAANPVDYPVQDMVGRTRPNPTGSFPDIGAYENGLGTPQEELCDYLSGTLGPGIFHVVCDIFVAPDSSLCVMPGTTLLFDSTCSFTIYGTLLAEGNPDSAIIFTSDTSLNANHWDGLQFLDTTSSGSQLAYCLIEKGLAAGEFPEHCGGAVRCSTSAPTFTCCTFRDNSATGSGGAVHCGYYRSPIFTNCVFSDNSTSMSGGGVYCVYCSSIFTNCTFTGNSAASSGGGVTCAQGSPAFFNTIIAFCEGQGIYFANTWSTHVEHCDFFGNSSGAFGGNSVPGGAGVLTTTNANGDSCDVHMNIFLDPMFADTAELDFHLTDYSSCPGAADPTDPPLVDRDGNPRPNPASSNPDIGAFEYWLAGPVRHLVVSINSGNAVLNWPPFATTCSIYGSADIGSQGDSLDTVTGVTTWTDVNTASRPSPYFYYVTAESPAFQRAGKPAGWLRK